MPHPSPSAVEALHRAFLAAISGHAVPLDPADALGAAAMLTGQLAAMVEAEGGRRREVDDLVAGLIAAGRREYRARQSRRHPTAAGRA